MKSKIVGILITIVILIIIGAIVRGIIVKKTIPAGGGGTTPANVTKEEQREPEKPAIEGPVTEEKTPIEIAFERAKDMKVNNAKAIVVNTILRPVLDNIFDTTDENGNVIKGVKMKEESGPMLTYVFNRKLTEVERDTIISGLSNLGVKAVDTTERVITVKNGSDMWVITFYLNNDEKSGLEVTF